MNNDNKNKCVDELSKAEWMTKPVYTQEMADNGVLPAVGMECLVHELSSNEFHKCTLLMIHKKTFVWDPEGWHGAFTTADSIIIKSLTPTIELVNGEAYQFDYINKTRVGFYDSEGDGMLVFLGGWCRPDSATNIKGPLTV